VAGVLILMPPLSNLGIGEEHHFTLMADLEAKLGSCSFGTSSFGNQILLIMDEPTNDLDFETIEWLENFLANYENTVIVVSHDRHFFQFVLISRILIIVK
jgi:ATPase subunit of ABC transporter with duplicated ATPase domains